MGQHSFTSSVKVIKEDDGEESKVSMKALIWNTRLVNTQKAFISLINLHKRFHFYLIGLMEPFMDRREIDNFKLKLGFQQAYVNINGKIWAFVDELMEVEIIGDEDQMLTLHIFNHGYDVDLCVSLVYAKCTHEERLPLWESLYNLAEGIDISWLVGGDFNTISSQKEKLGADQ